MYVNYYMHMNSKISYIELKERLGMTIEELSEAYSISRCTLQNRSRQHGYMFVLHDNGDIESHKPGKQHEYIVNKRVRR